METVTMLDKPNQRPANFDLAAHWKLSTKEFLEGRPQYQARLRMDPAAARQMKQWRPVSPVDDSEPPKTKGWVILNVRFENEEEACFVVLGFGSRVEVLKPEKLRERIAAEVSAMINHVALVGKEREQS